MTGGEVARQLKSKEGEKINKRKGKKGERGRKKGVIERT